MSLRIANHFSHIFDFKIHLLAQKFDALVRQLRLPSLRQPSFKKRMIISENDHKLSPFARELKLLKQFPVAPKGVWKPVKVDIRS